MIYSDIDRSGDEDMEKLPLIKTKEQLCALIEDIGFIPLFKSPLPGFSVMDITREVNWFYGEPEDDPWQWREEIATEGKIAYGKLFLNKAGFISKAWYPAFANFRRNGYDFDSLYEEGAASRKSKLIMDLFASGDILPTYEIKRLSGFGKGGEKGFDSALTFLQMKTYLTIRGFSQKKNKLGEAYGWPTAQYSTAEALFGEEHVRSKYWEDPKKSKEIILSQCRLLTGLSDEKLLKFIT